MNELKAKAYDLIVELEALNEAMNKIRLELQKINAEISKSKDVESKEV